MLTRQEYQQLIIEIKAALATKSTKTARQYYLIKTYEVYEVAGVKKIIGKRKEASDPIKFLVPFEDIFQTILMCHRNIGHKGRDLMMQECSKKYMNLTKDLITRNLLDLFLKFYDCDECKKRKEKKQIRIKIYLNNKIFSFSHPIEFNWLLYF